MGSAIGTSLLGEACRSGPKKIMTDNNAQSPTIHSPSSLMPVLFVAHGAPMLLDDRLWVEQLSSWAKKLPTPKAILIVSAHWENQPTTIGATKAIDLIYDFYGFPAKFYQIKYPSPGSPWLAERVKQLLSSSKIPFVEQPERGLDHGSYIPLMCMYPQATIPVLSISMPSLKPEELFALGKALAPLRSEQILVIGSGFLTHNMRALSNQTTPPQWASEFDQWSAEALQKKDFDKLIGYRQTAPGVAMALPTHEHFVPVFVSAGAAAETGDVTFPITGFAFGSFTKRSVQIG
jgi:4,5-DOPA dioxygenase extradiol